MARFLLIGKIRSMNGSNDNPIASQFISAYRKLLHQADITISNDSNVAKQCSSNILTISSLTNPSNEGKKIHYIAVLPMSGR